MMGMFQKSMLDLETPKWSPSSLDWWPKSRVVTRVLPYLGAKRLVAKAEILNIVDSTSCFNRAHFLLSHVFEFDPLVRRESQGIFISSSSGLNFFSNLSISILNGYYWLPGSLAPSHRSNYLPSPSGIVPYPAWCFPATWLSTNTKFSPCRLDIGELSNRHPWEEKLDTVSEISKFSSPLKFSREKDIRSQGSNPGAFSTLPCLAVLM